jgi:hypothetical protein
MRGEGHPLLGAAALDRTDRRERPLEAEHRLEEPADVGPGDGKRRAAWEELAVLQLAHAFEEATGFWQRRPALAG